MGVLELDGAVIGSTTTEQLATSLLSAENPGGEMDAVSVAEKKRDIVTLCMNEASWAAALAAKGGVKAR